MKRNSNLEMQYSKLATGYSPTSQFLDEKADTPLGITLKWTVYIYLAKACILLFMQLMNTKSYRSIHFQSKYWLPALIS